MCVTNAEGGPPLLAEDLRRVRVGMPRYRTEPPANALAHGPVKTEDVERARGVLYDVERHVMRERLWVRRLVPRASCGRPSARGALAPRVPACQRMQAGA